MISRLIHSIVSAAIIVLALPIIGIVIQLITMKITKTLAKATSANTALIIMNYITFIGTVHHEFSHALYALLTGAKVTKVEPFKPEGNTLGKVEFIPRGNALTKSIQLSMSAIAPTMQGLIDIVLIVKFLLTNINILWIDIIIIYIIFSIFVHMTMSAPDIKNFIKGLPICYLITSVVCFIFNVNIIGTVINIINTLPNK